MNIKSFLLFAAALFSNGLIFPQDIPRDNFLFKHENLLMDLGENWNFNSTLSGPRYRLTKDQVLEKDSLYISTNFGLNTIQSDLLLYSYVRSRTQSNLYTYFLPKIVSDPDAVPGFSGKSQENSRYGFEAGEIIYSGLGYENNWVMLQYGRGKENWSAGNNIQLSLSNFSSPYDYGVIEFKYKSYKTRYFHGWLERVDSTNRYITGKAFEWKSENKFILSLSEIIIYSGLDRQIDLSYLNPLSSHLEVELNKRQNLISSNGHSNAIWQIALDMFMKKNLRISMNFVIDELILDKIEFQSGKNNALAHSLRLAWSPKKEIIPLIVYYQYMNTGTNTFKHENGFNNFVQRDFPLGSTLGNDALETKFGLIFYNLKNYIFDIQYGFNQIGEKNLFYGMYKPNLDYEKGKFPSGNIVDSSFIKFKFIKLISNISTLSIEGGWNFNNKSNGSFVFKTELYYGLDLNSL